MRWLQRFAWRLFFGFFGGIFVSALFLLLATALAIEWMRFLFGGLMVLCLFASVTSMHVALTEDMRSKRVVKESKKNRKQ